MSNPPVPKPVQQRFSCKICTSPDSLKLDEALLSGTMSQEQVAKKVGCVRRTVYNHLRDHVGRDLALASAGKRESLIQALKELEGKTERILRECISKKQFDTALKAIMRREAQIKLVAEITGSLQEKAPNEAAQYKKAQQVEGAIQSLIQRAKDEGLTITYPEAVEQLLQLDPDLAEFLNPNWKEQIN